MVAVINDDAADNVCDVSGGGIKVRVATRDDSGANGVTILTGCNKQLHHVARGKAGRAEGPIVSRARTAAHAQVAQRRG